MDDKRKLKAGDFIYVKLDASKSSVGTANRGKRLEVLNNTKRNKYLATKNSKGEECSGIWYDEFDIIGQQRSIEIY